MVSLRLGHLSLRVQREPEKRQSDTRDVLESRLRVEEDEPAEWTPKTKCGFESYVDRMLKTQTKCPCGCGGMFVPPAKKEPDNAQGNDEE